MVCGILVALSVGFFFADDKLAAMREVPGLGRGVVQWGALLGPLVRAGEWHRVLAYAVEHGGAIHLAFNMMAVWTIGFAFERGIGSVRFALVSVGTTIGAAAFALLFNFDVTTVGASGTILGWAGAMLPIATRQGRRSIGTWLVQVAVISLLPNVSWAAHAGGFLFGLPFGLGLRLGREKFGLIAPLVIFGAAVLAVYAVRVGRISP